MEIELFIPCFIDQIHPETAGNLVKVLEKAGCKINYNPKQTCCGQPAFNAGYVKEAKEIASKFINDFSGALPIVCPGASCSGYILTRYPNYFAGTENESKCNKLCNNLFELCDFLVNFLKITDLGSVFNAKVTYHDSCTALREYGIKEEPRKLLSNVKGLELIEMKDSETCCGFGGTFSVKYKEISSAMVQQKVENAIDSGAEYITTTETSCLMNIESYISKNKLPIKAIHIVDILASGL